MENTVIGHAIKDEEVSFLMDELADLGYPILIITHGFKLFRVTAKGAKQMVVESWTLAGGLRELISVIRTRREAA